MSVETPAAAIEADTDGVRNAGPPCSDRVTGVTPSYCCVCGGDEAQPVGVGEDFDSVGRAETFLVMRCPSCGLVFLNPRPSDDHSADMTRDDGTSLTGRTLGVFDGRPARRLLREAGRSLPPSARILFIGDGAETMARLWSGWRHSPAGVDVLGTIPLSSEPSASPSTPGPAYHLVCLSTALAALPDPVDGLQWLKGLLLPGGRLLVLTENTDSAAYSVFQGRYWAGYQFPRRSYLFGRQSLQALARQTGMQVERIGTLRDPGLWTGSIRHVLKDLGANSRLQRAFRSASPVAIAAFAGVELGFQAAGQGGLLYAILRQAPPESGLPARRSYASGAARSQLPVAILGGGIAGLTAARALRAHGFPVVLFEAGKRIAGLATSFHDADGFSYDFGAHFITNRLASALGFGAHCQTVRHYGETVFLSGHTYGYPYGLLRNAGFTASGLRQRVREIVAHPVPARSAAEWSRRKYGSALADAVAIPLLEAWSGAAATELSPAVFDKVTDSIPRTLWLKTASRIMGRAVGINYCRAVPEAAYVWHVYPEGGVAALCQRAAEGLESVIRLESPVQEVLVDEDRVVAVRVHGREHSVAAVISTAPVNILPKLVRGTEALQRFARFRYRPMVFVNMRFRGRALLPDVVTWTPEGSFPFFRLTEAPLSMPWLAPEGKTMLTADIGCEASDAVWQMPDEALGELCLAHMAPVVPDARQRYLGCRVLRTPIAYPVFLSAYEDDRRALQQGTGVEGLYSIGRNGEFAHILMEDVYWRTLEHVRRVRVRLEGP